MVIMSAEYHLSMILSNEDITDLKEFIHSAKRYFGDTGLYNESPIWDSLERAEEILKVYG